MNRPFVAVIGGGPAGLSAAIHSARLGAETVVFERNRQCGAKLLATGGGRCNVTNARAAAEWPALFGRRGRFIVPALEFLPRSALAAWFASLGEPLDAPDGFHLFPVSNSAKAVRNALYREAKTLGAAIAAESRIQDIRVRNGSVAAIVDQSGAEIACDRAILATGGKSWPATGSTGDGCAMAERLGHRVTPAYPGLVGLRAENLDPDLAGLVLQAATVFFKAKGKGESRGAGELLLTHGGVSGPAVLDLSASAAEALADGTGLTLRLRWIGHGDEAFWLERLAAWRKEKGSAAVAALLREHLPLRLARWLCRHAGCGENATAATLGATVRDRLIEALSGFPARITGTEGWEKAMITRGGVDVRDVDPKTMESRVVKGLFFSGETLDMDGPCGGYNLHWAFASGALAGATAAGPGPSEP